MRTHISTTISTTDLVLIGGGHSHLAVIKQFGMNPLPGLRITVISRDIHTPYSGMVPGLIAGHYQHDDAHIDLRPLCQSANIRLFHSSVTNIDLKQQLIHCHNRPSVRFDWLSINTGSRPDLSSIQGASTAGIAVKPIDKFIHYWQRTIERLKSNHQSTKIVIVGGGAASVEVILAIQYRLKEILGYHYQKITLELLCSSATLLSGHNTNVQKYLTQTLIDRGIKIRTHSRVLCAENTQVNPQYTLHLSTGEELVCDELIWAIHAGNQQWIADTKLQCNHKDFIEVNPFLQSVSHPNVFAAGDVSHFCAQPLAKSGVYAVRAGNILAGNLRRAIEGKTLKAYRPQHHFLSILMTGDQYAIASKGKFSVTGSWVWRLKDYIDNKFMDKFSLLSSVSLAKQSTSQIPFTPQPFTPPVDFALDATDATESPHKLQTINYFRSFIDDPYLLGRIVTNHCLNSVYAEGGSPHSVHSFSCIPPDSDKIIEDTLFQLKQGTLQSLNEQNVSLIGEHISEGTKLGFGLCVNGVIPSNRSLTKTNLESGQMLILNKPIGMGVLLAANHLAKAQGRWIDIALEEMLRNNQQASEIFYEHQMVACTDLAEFGLIGHLIKLLKANNIGARLSLNSLPILDGTLQCISDENSNVTQNKNTQAQSAIINSILFQQELNYPLIFDPQTAGTLLAVVPESRAKMCIKALQQANYPQATIIGTIDKDISASKIVLT